MPLRCVSGCLLLAVSMTTTMACMVTVDTDLGRVRGVKTDKVQMYRKIPYATPPVGELRWKPPQPVKAWKPEVFDATGPHVACPQVKCEAHIRLFCPSTVSEDCLHLNVFTPLHATPCSGLPVLFFIHGGNFMYLSGTSPAFDSSEISHKGNVIVVTINYRLGALGFLVTGKGPDDARGNYGILDQRLAMKWVKSNIRSFGGDPDRVTIFGQSAGAQSVLMHFLSERSSAYYNSAILQSAAPYQVYPTHQEAVALAKDFAKDIGCPVHNLTCMRGMSALAVAESAYNTKDVTGSYWPHIDGIEITGQTEDVVKSGNFARKPSILGFSREESVWAVYEWTNGPVNMLTYFLMIAWKFPRHLFQVLSLYPPIGRCSDRQDKREGAVRLCTDLFYGCPTRHIARALVSGGNNDTYVYLFDTQLSALSDWGEPEVCRGRPCHGAELPFLFPSALPTEITAEEIGLSDTVINYWANFAWYADPNQQHPTNPPNQQHPINQPNQEHPINPPNQHHPTKPLSQHHPTKPQSPKQTSKTKENKEQDKLGDHNDNKSEKKLLHFISERSNSRLRKQSSPVRGTPEAVEWPRYSEGSGWAYMHFQKPTRSVVRNFREKYCDYWDKLGYHVIISV